MQKIFEHDSETLKSCETNESVMLFTSNLIRAETGCDRFGEKHGARKWLVREPARLSTCISNVSSNFARRRFPSDAERGGTAGLSRRIKTIDDVRIRLNDEQLDELHKRMICSFKKVRL